MDTLQCRFIDRQTVRVVPVRQSPFHHDTPLNIFHEFFVNILLVFFHFINFLFADDAPEKKEITEKQAIEILQKDKDFKSINDQLEELSKKNLESQTKLYEIKEQDLKIKIETLPENSPERKSLEKDSFPCCILFYNPQTR